jgi:hypothetical protein
VLLVLLVEERGGCVGLVDLLSFSVYRLRGFIAPTLRLDTICEYVWTLCELFVLLMLGISTLDPRYLAARSLRELKTQNAILGALSV